METYPIDPAEAAEWQKRERAKRGWSTTKLADVARAIAQRERATIKLTQQSVSGFEQPGKVKKLPDWIRYVEMAFQEGEAPHQGEVEARDELAYVRQVDIRYAMGDGAVIDDYPSSRLIPFNLNFLQMVSRAPADRLFLATGHGDSMEPTLQRDDVVLIDTTETRATLGDLIWAIEYAGSGYIKRLRRVRREGRDRILILSDNPSVPPEEADPAEVTIVGKVVWIARTMR
ncbi:S24 family peptidase [Sphingomonas sp. T9W2]|uniref:S24 family peptidase n=1 Tax=Sphingomonas sp. T9W2 TaxID=3143183 RepID=UPI0031F4CC09